MPEMKPFEVPKVLADIVSAELRRWGTEQTKGPETIAREILAEVLPKYLELIHTGVISE